MLTLQKDMYALCDWSLKWQLTFNASKCIHMTYGNAKVKSKYTMKEGDGKVTDIKHDDEVEKDLGVLFDTKLSFRQHIGCTVKKVNRMIGLTRRTFHYGPRSISAFIYFTNETTHGLRGLHLESTSEGRYCPAGKCTEKSDTIGTRP